VSAARSRTTFAAVLLAALLATGPAACGRDDAAPAEGRETSAETGATEPETTPARPAFAVGEVVIQTEGEPVHARVEIAETDEQRQFGLMFRHELDGIGGMVFLFPEQTSGGFWMKNTFVPLSIAFFDERGRIVRILDMEPCPGDPCPVYDPGVPYHGALEVEQGMFERWGIERGDRIRVVRR
jgi:uncharacterized membrane protein (UPF0127 family)